MKCIASLGIRMSLVNDAIEDCVCHHWVRKHGMQLLGRVLAGSQQGPVRILRSTMSLSDLREKNFGELKAARSAASSLTEMHL